MAKDDCFVYYIIATMLDGTKQTYAFNHLIGTNCSYKYVNMTGDIINLGKFTSRTVHRDSSPDLALGNIIHEAKEHSDTPPSCTGNQITSCSRTSDPKICNNSYTNESIGGQQCKWVLGCTALSPTVDSNWCDKNCNANPSFCPSEYCKCDEASSSCFESTPCDV